MDIDKKKSILLTFKLFEGFSIKKRLQNLKEPPLNKNFCTKYTASGNILFYFKFYSNNESGSEIIMHTFE